MVAEMNQGVQMKKKQLSDNIEQAIHLATVPYLMQVITVIYNSTDLFLTIYMVVLNYYVLNNYN